MVIANSRVWPRDMRYQAVLFDFDGVLADTEPLHYGCWQRLFAHYGFDLTWENYVRNLSGYSGEELMARLSRICPPTVGDLKTLYSRKKSLYRNLAPSRGLIPSTVAAFVQQLPLTCAVVTSSDRADVEWALRDAGLLSRARRTTMRGRRRLGELER